MDDSCTIKEIRQINISDYEHIESIMKAFSNKIRLAILDALVKNGQLCACELEIATNLPQPTVTLNLHRLYYAGILKKMEKSKYTYFSINEKFLSIINSVLSIKG
ncbi:MAG: helix-turn-helix transcriptional regulator [Conexivisphaerales archaeon]